MTYREKFRRGYRAETHFEGKGKIERSDYGSGGHTEIEGKDDEIYSCRETNQLSLGIKHTQYQPFGQRVEGLIGCFCNYRHLITTHSVYETAALNYCFRSYEDEIDLIHHIGYCRIKYDRTRNTCCRQSRVCFQSSTYLVSTEIHKRSDMTKTRHTPVQPVALL